MVTDRDSNGFSRFLGINKTFLKVVAEEGVNEYPTILFLLNRMFLSEKNNIGKNAGIDYKLKEGDSIYWYRGNKISVGSIGKWILLDKARSILNFLKYNINFFKLSTNQNLIGIQRYWHCNDGYFARKSTGIYYGKTLETVGKKINIPRFQIVMKK